MEKEWSFYFPDDGETADDAIPIIGHIFDAEHAAREACVYDFGDRDGWERGKSEFSITVVTPGGEERQFLGSHEPSVDHVVREAK